MNIKREIKKYWFTNGIFVRIANNCTHFSYMFTHIIEKDVNYYKFIELSYHICLSKWQNNTKSNIMNL